MKRYYKLTDRLIACALLLSLCLQSCDHSFNQVLAQEKEQADVILGSTKRIEIIKQLIEQKFTSAGWELKDLYEEQGELKAKVIEKHGDFTSKPHDLPVSISPDIDLKRVSQLSPKEQDRFVDFNLPQPGQPGYVHLNKQGLLGGMMEGDEDWSQGEEPVKGSIDDMGNPQQLLELAIQGHPDAQFMLGEKSYYVWLYQYSKEAGEEAKIWLNRAAVQNHQESISLLDKMEEEERELELDNKLEALLAACERLNLNKLLPLIPKRELEVQYNRSNSLGGGTFGEVYRANYRGKVVAVKRLRNYSRKQFAIFQRECIIMANYPHKNIVTFLGYCPQEGCLIMEYVTGGSLWSLLKDKTKDISWEQRYRIGLDVAEGLSYLHDRDIVHGDLKSENILLDRNGRAKVTDFGTSALKSEESTHGTWGGTYCWAAPETFLTEKNSKAADVYSYGMVLWQLGTRKNPFETVIGLLQICKHITAGNLEVISADTPPQLRKVIEKCWLPEPPLKKETDRDQRPAMSKVRYLIERSYYDFLEKASEHEVPSLEESKEVSKEKENTVSAREQELLNQVEKLKKELEEEKQKHDEKEKEKEKEKGSEASLGIVSVPKITSASVATVNQITSVDTSGKKSNSITTPAKVTSVVPLPQPITPIQKAISLGNLDKVLELLKNGLDVNEHSPSKDRLTALHYAVIYNQSNIVQVLLANGADINVVDYAGYTPLHAVAQHGHKEIVALLLEKGEKINATNTCSDTPLHVAAKHGHKDVVALLLEKGEEINATNTWGHTPFHFAAEVGDKDVVALLLEKGANVNATTTDTWGDTPLHLAARFGYKEVVALLIEKGADVNAADSDSETPLMLANQKNHTEIVKLLQQAGGH